MKRSFCFEYNSIIGCALTNYNKWTFDSLKEFFVDLGDLSTPGVAYVCMCGQVNWYILTKREHTHKKSEVWLLWQGCTEHEQCVLSGQKTDDSTYLAVVYLQC